MTIVVLMHNAEFPTRHGHRLVDTSVLLNTDMRLG